MKNLNKRLIRKIRETLPQYIAVSLVVLIGIMMYLGLSTSSTNLIDTVDLFRENTNSADIYIEFDRVSSSIIRYVKSVENVKDVQGRILKDVPLVLENDTGFIRLVSVPDHGPDTINSIILHEGTDLRSPSGGLVGKSFYDANGLSIDDKVKIQYQGGTYNINVDGVGASSEFIYPLKDEQSLVPDFTRFGIIHVSEGFAQDVTNFGSDYNYLLVKVNDVSKIDSTIDSIEKKLKKYGVKRVFSYEDNESYEIVTLKFEGSKKASGSVPIIFLGVAAFVIAMMLDKLVKNDRMAIGVLKALGYSNFDLILHYSMYSFGIALLGGSLGIYSGLAMADFFALIYIENDFDIPNLQGEVDYSIVVVAIVLTVVFCVGAGIIGARKVTKIHPADSMRPDPPKVGNRIFLEKYPRIWKKLKFSWKIVAKNLLRSKKRLVFLVLGIALTYSVLHVPFYMQNTIMTIFDDFYTEFLIMDYNVSFNAPQNETVIKQIKEVISYEDIGGKIDYPLELSNKWKKELILAVGLTEDSPFYNLVNIKGDRIYVPKNGVLITTTLASTLDVGKGDYITAVSYFNKEKEVKLRIEGIVDQSLGQSAYMNIDTMRRYFYDDQMITGVYVDSKDDVKGKLKDFKYITNIQSTEEMVEGFAEYLELMIAYIAALVIFGGILGFVIVYNSTIITIKERQLEFSSLRVMGFKKKEIFKTVLYENIIMTVIGIGLGIPLARAMGDSIGKAMSSEFLTLNAEAPPISYVYASVATVIFVLLSQVATFEKIRKLNFIEALKNRMS